MSNVKAYPPRLLDDALKLHMAITGASDPLSDEETEVITGRISRALVDWRASTPNTLHFDECVRHLLEAALAEWHES